ncbi:hypothetical protein [Sulfurimonas sp.]|uniref:hypothetical protein n=1 Tax=Sulfurimonas sp. TaxID=2022749 RepID=UPI003563F720
MQIRIIQRPALFSDFFNLEIDYKNDFLEYINTNNHKFDTSLLNTTKKRLNKELLELFKKLILHRAYRNIDRDKKHYIRVDNQMSLFVPREHIKPLVKAIFSIQKTAIT